MIHECMQRSEFSVLSIEEFLFLQYHSQGLSALTTSFFLTGWHIVGATMWHIPKHIHPFWTCLGTRDAVITIYKNMYDYVYITWLFDFTYYFRYDNPSRVSRLLKAMNSADRGVRSKALRLVHVSTQMDPVLQVFPQVSVTNTLTITTNFHVVMVCHISNL